jgi:hypothetical protein
VTVKSCDEKSIIEIASYINDRAKKVKSKSGDDEHKKRVGAAVFFPPFLISVLLNITKILSYYLSLTIPAIGL